MEELKAKGNELFGKAKYLEAFNVYQDALEVKDTDQDHAAPAERARLRAILHSNSSACMLLSDYLKNTEEALKQAFAAVVADPTFEKAQLRVGAALEAMQGRRLDAIAVYRSLPNNEAAQQRMAALARPYTLTPRGIAGIADGSLDPRQLQPFAEARKFYFRMSVISKRRSPIRMPTLHISSRSSRWRAV